MDLRFVGVNVWLGGLLMENLIPFLKEQNADVICMQEVFESPHTLEIHPDRRYHTMKVLREALGFEYSHFAPSWVMACELGPIPIGNGVLSKYPIAQEDVSFYIGEFKEEPVYYFNGEALENAARNLQLLTLETPGGPVHIANTHGVWGTHGGDTDNRWKMTNHFKEVLKDKDHVILTGDFNTDERSSCMESLEEHFTNILKGTRENSFNMKRKTNPGFATAIVDTIYVSKDWEVLEAACPQVDVTDHLPVTTTLRMTGKV